MKPSINMCSQAVYFIVIVTLLAPFITQLLLPQQLLTYGQSTLVAPVIIKDNCLGKDSTSLGKTDQSAAECISTGKLTWDLKNYTEERRATAVVKADRNDTAWSGILDTISSSIRLEGRGDNTIKFACEEAGTYSIVIQLEGAGRVEILVFGQEGRMLDFGMTAQKNGRVSLSGNCNSST
jgi:hypothetical protein